jgi:MYXO-CTERM domain-containing protein
VAGGGGCSVTATPVFTSSLWSMLGLLGLVVRRRRRRS